MDLKHFTLAGGALLAAPTLLPAGTIQYSGVQNLTVTVSTGSLNSTSDSLTVKMDGLVDTFTVHNSFNSGNGELVSYVEPLGTVGLALTSQVYIGQSANYTWLAAYAYGDPVGTTLNSEGLLAAFKNGANANWSDQNPHYFGLQFDAGGKSVSGWVQAQVTRTDSTFQTKVIDWAYDVDGDPITAGAGATTVPEPSSMALLALGAAGLVALRKRRK